MISMPLHTMLPLKSATRSRYLLAWLLITIEDVRAVRPVVGVGAPRASQRHLRAPSIQLQSVADAPAGLVNFDSCEEFYTRRLTKMDLAVLRPGVMWKAAELDATTMGFASAEKYLNHIEIAMDNFFDSGELWDREKLIRAIRTALKRKGMLCMLLGGKSCGKTFLLNSMRKQLEEEELDILYVNAREIGTDLSKGIIQAAYEDAGRFEQFLEAGKKVAPSIAQVLAKLTQTPDLSRVLQVLLDTPPTAADALKSFIEAAAQRGRFPCIIVDEANIVFSEQANKAVLDLFVLLTKEQLKLTVLLASSEHGFPFKLQNSLGFNLLDLEAVIHAGEVPPDEMRTLLIKRWGMGDQLADCLLASVGGHIMLARRAVCQLSIERDSFTPLMSAQQGLTTSIVECLEAEVERPGVRDVMRKLATNGFAPLDKLTNPIAEKLSFHRVAGAISYESTVVGLPREVWMNTGESRRYKAGLVPTSQMARLLMMMELQELDAGGGEELD